MRKEIILISLLFNLIFLIGIVSSTTYYVDGSLATDSGDGSQNHPKKYISSGIDLMNPGGGDVLIIRDGIYNTQYDLIDHFVNGMPGAYNIIKAENDGRVTITYSNGINLENNPASYVQIEGINFNSLVGKVIFGHHIKILKCSFVGSASSGNTVTIEVGAMNYGDTHDILFEDCYAYGSGGRYNFLVYRAYNVVFRRCISRHDPGWTGDGDDDPEAAFNSYSSQHIYFQNCIAIDCDQNYVNWYSGFYATEHDGARVHNHWDGCISFNNNNIGFYIDPTTSIEYYFNNCISYDSTNAGFAVNRGANGGVSGFTIGRVGNGIYNSVVSNSIIFDFNEDGINTGSGNYCDIEGGGSSCTNCQTYNPLTNGLVYLPRVEAGSALSNAGSSGGQIGANIMKKIGISGTLYGESGWNTITNESLWPWPYEARIKNDMKVVSTRGFCASGNGLYGGNITLTSYIWEALGNPCPADICNYNGTINPSTTNKTTIQSLIIEFKKFKTGTRTLNYYIGKIKEFLLG
jgi:hypothetical protein